MSPSRSLDDFLGPEEPNATFHDAALVSLLIHYERRELLLDWDLCVGNPDAASSVERERTRRGRLRFTGLCFWVVDPPDDLLAGARLP